MEQGAFGNSSSFSKLLLSFGVIILSFLIITFLGTLLSLLFFDSTILDKGGNFNFNDLTNIGLMKYLQALSTFALFIIPPFLIGYLINKNAIKYLDLNKKPDGVSLSYSILLIIFALPFINFLLELNANLKFPEFLQGVEFWMKSREEEAKKITELFLKVDSVGGLTINLFVIGILPAIGEELLFRGVIQKIFTQMTRNIHAGIWIAAILFSTFHIQFYGFLPRMILGVLFGYLLVWSKNIWLPIICHFMNNAFAVLAYYLSTKKIIGDQADTVGTQSDTYIFAIISCIVLFALMFLIYKREQYIQNRNIAKTVDLTE